MDRSQNGKKMIEESPRSYDDDTGKKIVYVAPVSILSIVSETGLKYVRS